MSSNLFLRKGGWCANQRTADHVDILGRSSLNDPILQVAGGRGELINETIHSNILEYAEKVKVYEEEEHGWFGGSD